MQPHRSTLLTLALLTLASPSALAQWSAETLSGPRNGASAASIGDFALIAGGMNVTIASDKIDIYDSTSGALSSYTLTTARALAAGVTVGPYVLFAGGALDLQTPSNVVDVYDSSKGLPDDPLAWSVVHLTQARVEARATSVDGKAFFAGGILGDITSPTYSDVIDVYDSTVGPPSDPLAWSVEHLSVPRVVGAATSAGDRALFAGGYDGVNVLTTVDVYDAGDDMWSLTDLSQARASMAAASVGELACFGGGTLGGGVFSAVVDVYDANDGSWSANVLSQARGQLAATALGNCVLFAGGLTTGNVVSAVVDRLDVGTGLMVTTGPLSSSRGGLCATSVGGRALFACGSKGFGFPSDVLDVYAPVGETYCVAKANSLGCAATIDAVGTSSLASNFLLLQTSCVPNNVFIYFYAQTEIQVPFGDGYLCAGGQLTRILPGAFASGGVAEKLVNLPAVGITTPGVRRFQCWYRDPTGGPAGFNTSNALSIEFVP